MLEYHVELEHGDELPDGCAYVLYCRDAGHRVWSEVDHFPYQAEADIAAAAKGFVPAAGYEPAGCEWFALCERPAAVMLPHPMLGQVPTCAECAEKVDRLDRR